MISFLIHHSYFSSCGALHVGDELLAIDDVGLEYTTLAEAKQLLRGGGSSIGNSPASNARNRSPSIRLEIIPHSQMIAAMRRSLRESSTHNADVQQHRRQQQQSNGQLPTTGGQRNLVTFSNQQQHRSASQQPMMSRQQSDDYSKGSLMICRCFVGFE